MAYPTASAQGLTTSSDHWIHEELALDQKRAELATLQTNLIERELALLNLHRQLPAFRAEYLRTVGKRYAALDDLDARMAASRAARRPDDTVAREAARQAWNTSDASAAQMNDPALLEPQPPFDPAAEIQTLYRALARKLHPDLAATDEERALRRPWMKKLDAAYTAQDGAALEALDAEWGTRPETVRALEVGGELARAWLFGELTTGDYAHRIRISNELVELRRQSSGATQRIKTIDGEFKALKAGDLYTLYGWHTKWLQGGWTLRGDTPSAAASPKSQHSRPQPSRNLLEQMAAWLDAQIAEAQREDSGEPHRQVPASRDAGDLVARGLADLVKRVEFTFTKEQWDRLRPQLDRVWQSVVRDMKPGTDLPREFIRLVRDALERAAKLPTHIVKAAVKRWNRETNGGEYVALEEDAADQAGGGSAGGKGASAGKGSDGKVGTGKPGAVPPTGEGGKGAASGKERADATGTDGAKSESAESEDDADADGTVHETRVVTEAERSIVGPSHQAEHGASDTAEDCCKLGRLCERDGNRKDAATWYHRAAEREHVDGQYQLGLMYLHGQGRPQVHTVAAMWFRRAADQGHANAQHHLGLMYRDGQGVVQDRDDAATWLRLAADQGHFEARSILDQEAHPWPESNWES